MTEFKYSLRFSVPSFPYSVLRAIIVVNVFLIETKIIEQLKGLIECLYPSARRVIVPSGFRLCAAEVV
jgi:hypothetical protein